MPMLSMLLLFDFLISVFNLTSVIHNFILEQMSERKLPGKGRFLQLFLQHWMELVENYHLKVFMSSGQNTYLNLVNDSVEGQMHEVTVGMR